MNKQYLKEVKNDKKFEFFSGYIQMGFMFILLGGG